MPKIWRVENKHGFGPYQSMDRGSLPIDDYNPLLDHKKENGHPSPYYDIGIERKPKNEEFCGFLTKRQAEKWFSEEEFRYMEAYGFKLKQIDVDEITAKGIHQVLAIREIHNVDELEFIMP